MHGRSARYAVNDPSEARSEAGSEKGQPKLRAIRELDPDKQIFSPSEPSVGAYGAPRGGGGDYGAAVDDHQVCVVKPLKMSFSTVTLGVTLFEPYLFVDAKSYHDVDSFFIPHSLYFPFCIEVMK
jgi:hypothetical protein